MTTLQIGASNRSGEKQSYDLPFNVMELRNGHTAGIQQEDIPMIPEFAFHDDAGKLMHELAGSESTGIVFNTYSQENAALLGKDIVWLAQKCYGRESLVVRCQPNGVSETNAEFAIDQMGSWLSRRHGQRLLVLEGIDNLVGENGPQKSNIHAKIGSAVRSLMQNNIGDQRIAAISSGPSPQLRQEFAVQQEFSLVNNLDFVTRLDDAQRSRLTAV